MSLVVIDENLGTVGGVFWDRYIYGKRFGPSATAETVIYYGLDALCRTSFFA